MKNYLAVDSGGTKVIAVLYDENFRIKKVCRVGSLRGNTTPKDLIEKNLNDLVNGLELDSIETIDHITGTIDSVFYKRISENCKVGGTTFCGELDLGLAAACIFGDGVLALSGTGATMFSRYNGVVDASGGYGAAVSDAGSGYWIGRHAMEAAAAYDEERGEATMLRDMITAYFGKSCLKDSIFSIYAQDDVSPAASVASCAPLVTEAANLGDDVAHDIIIKAGRIIGEQLRYIIKKHDIPESVPVTVSGSVWRGHPDLFAEFSRVIYEYNSNIKIVFPEFEPIVGAVIQHFYSLYGKLDSDDLEFFRNEYSRFLFSVNHN